jgi:hypothetical protein
MIFCQRYGSGFLEAVTGAQKGDAAWEEAREVLHQLANDGMVLHSQGLTLKFLDTPAKSAMPFEPLVEQVNRLYAKCYRGIDLATGSRAAEPGAGRHPIGASVQKEESGIFLARDAAWAAEYLNDRVDRPILRYLFNKEPRAWMTIMPPLDDNAAEDLKSVQALVPMGLRISLKEAYKRFRWTLPADTEPCLQFSLQTNPTGREGGNPMRPQEKPTLPATSPAQDDLQTPIGAGADPKRNPQTANPEMPDPQVDDAGFYSAAPTMPTLGFAIPNEPLSTPQFET